MTKKKRSLRNEKLRVIKRLKRGEVEEKPKTGEGGR